jgi:hypothetical protein
MDEPVQFAEMGWVQFLAEVESKDSSHIGPVESQLALSIV